MNQGTYVRIGRSTEKATPFMIDELKEKLMQNPMSFLFFMRKKKLHDIMKKWCVSRATAQRWLQVLVNQQKIKRLGKTRNVRYQCKGAI